MHNSWRKEGCVIGNGDPCIPVPTASQLASRAAVSTAALGVSDIPTKSSGNGAAPSRLFIRRTGGGLTAATP